MDKWKRWTRALALAVASATWAYGGPLTAAPRVMARPTSDEIKAAWPAAAANAGVQGVAGMRCRVAVDGSVADCAPLIETPKGQGFGAALVTLAPKYRFLAGDAGQVVVVQASWPAWDTAADWPGRPALNSDAFSHVTGAGAALVACIVETDGKLSDCVIADAVGDTSVARAALDAAKGVKLRPALSQGQPVQSIFTIPIKLGGH
jgi:TonB family protein